MTELKFKLPYNQTKFKTLEMDDYNGNLYICSSASDFMLIESDLIRNYINFDRDKSEGFSEFKSDNMIDFICDNFSPIWHKNCIDSGDY
jgi:hypothetical protein